MGYRKQVDIDSETVLLDILDTWGQEEFASMQDQWIREGQGFLLVYTITSMQSFEEMKNFHRSILRSKDTDKVPLVIAGNKCDLKDASDSNQVPFATAQALAESWECPIFETSAKEKINNELCFYEVVREIRKVDKVLDPQIEGTS